MFFSSSGVKRIRRDLSSSNTIQMNKTIQRRISFFPLSKLFAFFASKCKTDRNRSYLVVWRNVIKAFVSVTVQISSSIWQFYLQNGIFFVRIVCYMLQLLKICDNYIIYLHCDFVAYFASTLHTYTYDHLDE